MSMPRARIAAEAGRLGRLIRYGFVGGVVAALYTLFTIILLQGHFIADPTLASAIAFAITLPVSFLAHLRITYADAARDQAQSWRFGVIALSSFLVSTGAMKAVVLLGKPYWIAIAITWILVPSTNYIINALWVFRVSGLFAVDPRDGERS